MLTYVAQRLGSWVVLHRDLPITLTSRPEWGVNFYGVIEGFMKPGFDNRGEDGFPLIDEGRTLIHAETGSGVDRRRWSGLVDEVTPVGGRLKVRVVELHGAVEDLIFTGNIHGVKVDPADVARQLWGAAQARPSGDLGITVVGSTSRRVGTDSDLKAAAAKKKRDDAKAALEARSKPRKNKEAEIRKIRDQYAPLLKPLTKARDTATKAYDQLVKDKASKPAIEAARENVKTKQVALKAKRDERDEKIQPLNEQLSNLRDAEAPWKEPLETAEEEYRSAQEKAREDRGGLKIEADDYPNTWKTIVDLAEEHGFEFTTRTTWTDGRPDFTVRIHDPEAGTLRDDLTFQQGVNIISKLLPRSLPYATEILGRGAGEGAGAVRSTAARDDGRFPRNRVLALPDVKSGDLLRARVRRELNLASGALEIPSITVRDHNLARLWSWNAGDTILVQGNVEGAGPVALWHRIRSWRLLSEIDAELNLERVFAL